MCIRDRPAAVQQRIDALSISRQSAEDAHAEQRGLRQDAKDADPGRKQEAQRDARAISRQRADDTASRALYRALYSPNQLQEQMTWFWMNHFNVYAAKNDVGTYIDQYEAVSYTHLDVYKRQSPRRPNGATTATPRPRSISGCATCANCRRTWAAWVFR